MGALDFLMNEIHTSKKKRQRNRKERYRERFKMMKKTKLVKFDPLKE